MTKYTADAHALPYPEGVDRVAVAEDLQALAIKAAGAITQEGAQAKAYTDAESAKDRVRVAAVETRNQKQDADIRETLRAALAYADLRAADIERTHITSHVALDVDGTPYFRLGSTTVQVRQDVDGTPFYYVP